MKRKDIKPGKTIKVKTPRECIVAHILKVHSVRYKQENTITLHSILCIKGHLFKAVFFLKNGVEQINGCFCLTEDWNISALYSIDNFTLKEWKKM